MSDGGHLSCPRSLSWCGLPLPPPPMPRSLCFGDSDVLPRCSLAASGTSAQVFSQQSGRAGTCWLTLTSEVPGGVRRPAGAPTWDFGRSCWAARSPPHTPLSTFLAPRCMFYSTWKDRLCKCALTDFVQREQVRNRKWATGYPALTFRRQTLAGLSLHVLSLPRARIATPASASLLAPALQWHRTRGPRCQHVSEPAAQEESRQAWKVTSRWELTGSD